MKKTVFVEHPDPRSRAFLVEKLSAHNLDVRPNPEGVDLVVSAQPSRLGGSTRTILVGVDPWERHRYRGRGAFDVISRPVSMPRLYKSVEGALKQEIAWEERRGTRRKPLRIPIRVVHRNPIESTVIVDSHLLDISDGGYRIERRDLQPDDSLWEIDLGDRTVSARVVHSDETSIGLRLLSP